MACTNIRTNCTVHPSTHTNNCLWPSLQHKPNAALIIQLIIGRTMKSMNVHSGNLLCNAYSTLCVRGLSDSSERCIQRSFIFELKGQTNTHLASEAPPTFMDCQGNDTYNHTPISESGLCMSTRLYFSAHTGLIYQGSNCEGHRVRFA